jgi:drug/metabolite transporter (DMT)-like permease
MLTGLLLAFAGVGCSVVIAVCYKFAALRACNRETILAVERVTLLGAVLVPVSWLGDTRPSAGAAAIGLATGLALVFGRRCYVHALEYGLASLSWFILTLSQIAPIAVALIVFGERPAAWQAAGMVLTVPALLAIGSGVRRAPGASFRRWLPLIATAAAFEAAVGVLFLLLRELDYGPSRNLYLLSYNAVAVVTALGLRVRRFARPAPDELRIGIASGVATAGATLASIYAIFRLPAFVYFPLVTSSVVLLFTTVSVLVWKERLSRRQWLGLGLGVAAIVLVCIPR